MNLHTITVLLLVSLVGVIVLLPSDPAQGCATAPPPNTKVDVAQESAIIIWDSASKTQHFIRRASFQTNAPDFGFLVPTPGKPTLAKADDAAFDTLEEMTEPEVVTKWEFQWGGTKSASKMRKAGSVRVLETGRVSGFNYDILEASDPQRLEGWLKEHGYPSRPALTAWFAPYVNDRWLITAFKVAKNEHGKKGVTTSAVRMTFQTEQPFFPYREPKEGRANSRSQSRLLRVYVLSDKKMVGSLGKNGKQWPGKVVWANAISADDREEVLQHLKLPARTPPDSWWLTEFEDHSSPRPGTADVYFSVSTDQSPVARTPLSHTVRIDVTPWVCVGVVIILPLLVWVLFLLGRRLRRSPNKNVSTSQDGGI